MPRLPETGPDVPKFIANKEGRCWVVVTEGKPRPKRCSSVTQTGFITCAAHRGKEAEARAFEGNQLELFAKYGGLPEPRKKK